MPQFFLLTFPLSGAAQRLWFHLFWRSQTNAIRTAEVTFDTIWEFQLVLMPLRYLLSKETNHSLTQAMTVFGDTSHKVALHLGSFHWDHPDSQHAGLHLHQAIF